MGLKDFFINPCCKTWQDRMKQKDAIIDKQAADIAALRTALAASNTWLHGMDNEGQAMRRELNYKLLTPNEDATDD